MSLGFRLFSFFNGKCIGKDTFGNMFYTDKNNHLKRWVLYAKGFGPESLPTEFHNWLHNTTNELPSFGNNAETNEKNVKLRIRKHELSNKSNTEQGYNSWQPK